MTTDKIKTILQSFNIINPMNRWLRLLPNITIINLSQDANIYLGDNQLCYFDTSNNLLIISTSGAYKTLELSSNETARSKYEKNSVYVSTDKIDGFISSSVLGPGGVYIKRRL